LIQDEHSDAASSRLHLAHQHGVCDGYVEPPFRVVDPGAYSGGAVELRACEAYAELVGLGRVYDHELVLVGVAEPRLPGGDVAVDEVGNSYSVAFAQSRLSDGVRRDKTAPVAPLRPAALEGGPEIDSVGEDAVDAGRRPGQKGSVVGGGLGRVDRRQLAARALSRDIAKVFEEAVSGQRPDVHGPGGVYADQNDASNLRPPGLSLEQVPRRLRC